MDDTQKYEQGLRRLTWLNVAVLILLGSILVGGEFWIQTEFARLSACSQILDQVGKCHWTSSRIVRAARDMQESSDPGERKARLDELTALRRTLITYQRGLASLSLLEELPAEALGDPDRMLARLADHSQTILSALGDFQAAGFGGESQEAPPPWRMAGEAAFQRMRDAQFEFGHDLNESATEFNELIDDSLRRIRIVDISRLALALALLIAVSQLVFRRAFRRTRRGIVNLERSARELAEARDGALDIARSKSAFLANMSHEIRTPMNNVIGVIQILSKTDLSEFQRELVQAVGSSAHVLLHIINEILDLSKIEAGKIVFENQEFDVRKVVGDAVLPLAQAAQTKDLEFITHFDHDVPRILIGDSTRIAQVITNLADNAIKFTEQGEVFLRVSCESLAADEARILFSIRDSGIGISRRQLRRLFQPFSQGDESMTRRFGGTGLGLAISKHLVERMRGSIDVASRHGEGSLFRFILPLRLPSRPSIGEPESSQGHDLSSARALVVDGNDTSRNVLCLQLGSAGVDCRTASSGAEAMFLLRESASRGNPFHVVVMDIHLTDMNGTNLAEKIRSEPGLRELPMVLLTPLARVAEDPPPRERHFGARLIKPVSQDKLLATVESLLTGGPDLAIGEGVCVVEPRPTLPLPAARILVVEDNPANRRLIEMQLGGLGHVADLVAGGKDAIARLRERDYDIVLMDCQMAGMDGYETTRRIRDAERGRHTPIVALTAHAMSGDREKCIEAGMDDYLAKPVTEEALSRLLDRWLGESPPAPVKAESPPETPADETLDPQVLGRICAAAVKQGKPGELATILSGFLDQVDHDIADISRSVGYRDAAKAARLIHSLRGCAATYGATRLANACDGLDSLIVAARLDQARVAIASLEEEARRVRRAVERELPERLGIGRT